MSDSRFDFSWDQLVVGTSIVLCLLSVALAFNLRRFNVEIEEAFAHDADPDDFTGEPVFYICTDDVNCIPMWDVPRPDGTTCYAATREFAICVRDVNELYVLPHEEN